MLEHMKAYVAGLEKLTNEELDRSAVKTTVDEKDHTARTIAHIAEIGRRGAYQELGYPNLFSFCVQRLNLSEGSV